jgi:hypothetical protein
MLKSVFAEDIFSSFTDLVTAGVISVQAQDHAPIISFYTRIFNSDPLTKNQANYVLKILEKYKYVSAAAGLDYQTHLATIQWRQPFRVLDLSKSIYVERADTGQIEICLKFPFQLKNEFDAEIGSGALSGSLLSKSSRWDPEEKVRRLNVYDFNLISLYEFANKHNFEIDESFMSVLADVEEIWQNADDVLPYSEITNLGVELKNASVDAQEWWQQHHTESFENDLLLAKSMGYRLRKMPVNLVEKIAVSTENSFWAKDKDQFFFIYKKITGRVCVILDRTSNTLQWLQSFVAEADKHSVSREEIKVCFRDSKDSNAGLNEWIKLAGVGGKVETGRILIFESKPAKWLFKDSQDVTILVTNNLYPPTNTMAKEWFQSHPCVIYLGDIRPSEQRGQKIVEL